MKYVYVIDGVRNAYDPGTFEVRGATSNKRIALKMLQEFLVSNPSGVSFIRVFRNIDGLEEDDKLIRRGAEFYL